MSKRHLGDRRDAHLVRNTDGMHLIMPMLYPGRCDNEAYVSQVIDLTAINAYLEKRNAENPEFKFTIFHVIVAAVLKLITLRPKLNYFIQNKNLYEHNEVTASFIIKKQFDERSEEGMARIVGTPEDTLDSVHDELYRQISHVKKSSGEASGSTEGAMNLLNKLPRFIVKLFIALMRWCDRHGMVPYPLIAEDPYYASVILSNLGSIKLKSGYHHLTNWGTTSVFVIVGEKKLRPYYSEDGSYELHDSIDLGLTIDERVADGYYYSKSVRMLKWILEHPECLEQPLGTPVDVE